MSIETFVPDENEIIMGRHWLGHGHWRYLTEEDTQRGLNRIKAEALRDAALMVADRGGMGTTIICRAIRGRADRIEGNSND